MTAKREFQKKPLYRKVNTKARGVFHHSGGKSKHDRNTKAEKTKAANEIKQSGIAKGVRRGLDYTPLFRFLLKSVGRNWQDVYQEAAARLDRTEPIFWIVAKERADARQLVVEGENAYFHGLFVDEDDILQIVNPDIGLENLWPTCSCCTHTLNGKPFTNAFTLEKRSHNYRAYP